MQNPKPSTDTTNAYFVYERSSLSMNGHFCPQNLYGPTAHNWPTRPLALPPPPRMWTPMDYYYGQYYRPCFGHNMNTSHVPNCCLSRHVCSCSQQEYDARHETCHRMRPNERQPSHECECNETNSSTYSQPIITEESANSLNVNKEETKVDEQNDLVIEGIDQCNDKSTINELKAINQTLRESLCQTTTKLKETQMSLIKLSEKFAITCIQNYRKELMKCCDYIKAECTRFQKNESMSVKLTSFVDQITNASNKAKQEKERIREMIDRQKVLLNEEVNAFYELIVFDYKSLDELPDLLSLYKSLIDELPIQLFDDFIFLKKSSMASDEPVLYIHKIKDISNLESNNLETKDSELESNLKQVIRSEETFPTIALPDVSTINTSLPAVISLPCSSSDFMNTLEMNTTINLSNDNVLTIDSKPGEVDKPEALPKLTLSQLKLLDRLKDKYKDMSDNRLIEYLMKAKESIISSGNPKGFTGMKISDIIQKISQFIDDEVAALETIPKGRTNAVKQIWGKTPDQCMICFQKLPVNDKYVADCRHSFHNSCIRKWVKSQNSCPICMNAIQI